MTALLQRLTSAAERAAGHPSLVYAVIAGLAFPVTEMLVARRNALQYAHDIFDTVLPLNVAFARDPSLWSTAITSGNATLVQGAVPPATPDVWLSWVLPPFFAYLLTVALLIWVAGYGMHRFVRDSLGLPSVAAFTGGAIYALSFWHFVYGFSAALLPLVLWATDRVVRAGHRWHLPAALLVGLAALSMWWGHLQVFAIVALVQLAYLAVVLRGRMAIPRALLTWIATWGAAALLFAPVLVTLLVSLPDSHRAVWNLEYLYPGTLGERLDDALTQYRAVAIGIPIPGVSPGTLGYYGTWHAGGIALPLLVIGLLGRRLDRRAAFLAGLLAAIPLIDLVATSVAPHMDAAGILRSFQLVRIRHIVPFALAANTAIGMAVLISAPRGWRRWAGVAACLAIVPLALWQVGLIGARLDEPIEVPHQRVGWIVGTASLLVGTVGALAIAILLVRRTPRTAAVLLVLVIVLLLGERALYARHERLVSFGLGTWAQHLEPDPARAYIAERTAAEDRTLTVGAHPNPMAMVGLSDAAGYSTVYPRAYHAVFGALAEPFLATHPWYSRYFHEWGNRAYIFGTPVDHEVLDMMGVRWVYARDMPLEGGGLVERFRWRDTVVYENTDAFPRAYLVDGVEHEPTLERVAEAIGRADRSSLRTRAWILASTPAPAGEGTEPGEADIVAYDGDRVVLRTDSTAPSLLVLTDVMAAGWEATVDGEPVEIISVNGAFRGVRVPAGPSEVVMEYRPPATTAGLGIAAAGVLGLALWTVWHARRWRRHRHTHAAGHGD